MTPLPRPPRPATGRCVRVLLARLIAVLRVLEERGSAEMWE